jgi:hypothetical protein
MTKVDYSMSVGRPLQHPKVADAATDAAAHDEEEQSSRGHGTDSTPADSESVSNKDVSASTKECSPSYNRPDAGSPFHEINHKNGFHIHVPNLSDKEDYEHLPGYFTVQKILREVKSGKYLAKLRSGEIDLVSAPYENVLKL